MPHCLYLRKEGLYEKEKNKLMPKSEGLFKILQMVGHNAYKDTTDIRAVLRGRE